MTNDNRPATGQAAARARSALAAALGLTAVLAGLTAWLWLGDWRWTLTGLAGLLIAILVSAALQPPQPKRTPHEAAVDNALSDVLVEHYGFLPLTTRYCAASLAREHVETWRQSFEADLGGQS